MRIREFLSKLIFIGSIVSTALWLLTIIMAFVTNSKIYLIVFFLTFSLTLLVLYFWFLIGRYQTSKLKKYVEEDIKDYLKSHNNYQKYEVRIEIKGASLMEVYIKPNENINFSELLSQLRRKYRNNAFLPAKK